ncbi:MAG: c-type cytochrome [Desulfovibrio sp.]|nr:c-type cytochrome [Desulfovibrio sp.]
MSSLPSPPEPDKSPCPFYPNHLFVEGVCALAVFAAIVIVALVWQVPLEEIADPGDATYVPRPDWYFLFYFQLLKYFQGPLIVVGTFVLPVLVMAVLILLPFFDKGKATGIRKRPLAAAAGLAGVVSIVALTAVSVLEDESHTTKMVLPPVTEAQIAAGEKIFASFCQICHSIDGKGGFMAMAPDLTEIASRVSRARIEQIIIDPQVVSPTTIMSVIPLSEEERHNVSAYLSRKK